MPLTDTAARDLLGEDLLEALRACVAKGVEDGFGMYPETAHIHRITTRRSIIRDHIVYELKRSLATDARVRHTSKNQTDYFHLQGRFCVLVKKADDEMEVELAKTQASLAFKAQEQGVLDPEVIPDIINAYLAYVPGGADPTAPPIYLICPHKDGIEWKLELVPPPAKADAEITPAAPDGPEVGDDLVVPKKRDDAG